MSGVMRGGWAVRFCKVRPAIMVSFRSLIQSCHLASGVHASQDDLCLPDIIRNIDHSLMTLLQHARVIDDTIQDLKTRVGALQEWFGVEASASEGGLDDTLSLPASLERPSPKALTMVSATDAHHQPSPENRCEGMRLGRPE